MLSVCVYRAPLRDCRGSNGHIRDVNTACPSMEYEYEWNRVEDSEVKEISSAPVDTKKKEMGRAVKERAGLCFLNTEKERGIV
jgi:hypothetical protein